MKTGNRPLDPRCPLGAIQPSVIDTEQIKADAWNNEGILVLSWNDPRLDWFEAQTLKNIGDKIYGTK